MFRQPAEYHAIFLIAVEKYPYLPAESSDAAASDWGAALVLHGRNHCAVPRGGKRPATSA